MSLRCSDSNEKALIETAEQLFQNRDFNKLISVCENILKDKQACVQAWFLMAEAHHNLGDLPKALSAYYKTVDLQPEHQRARVKIEMIESILNFFNPDMYNP